MLEVYKNEIIYSEKNIKILPIKASNVINKNKYKTDSIENPNIRVIDL